MSGGTTIQTDEKMARMSLLYSDTQSWDYPLTKIHIWMAGDTQYQEFRKNNNKPVNRVDIPWRITSGIYMGKI